MISGGADKKLIKRDINLKAIAQEPEFRTLVDRISEDESQIFDSTVEIKCQNKVFSMDIASDAQCLTTGHDGGVLGLWQIEAKKMQNVGNRVSTDSKETLLRTMVDPTASIVITSSTTKNVTIYNVQTAKELARFCPGEITTAMVLSNDSKRLITTSDKGVIYVWKVPQ
jgi:WD40 repeat protein